MCCATNPGNQPFSYFQEWKQNIDAAEYERNIPEKYKPSEFFFICIDDHEH